MEDLLVPAPGEPGSETWKDKNNAWQTGGGAIYVTGSYDPQSNLTYWGTGNPAPRYNSSNRPGDNLFTNSSVAFDAATGKMQWFFQHTANDNRDYDSSGPQIIIDSKVNNEDRKLLVHANRNGFHYALGSAERPIPEGDTILRRSPGPKASIPRPASPSTTIPPRTCRTIAIEWKGGADISRTPAPTYTAAPTSGRRPTAGRPSCSTSPAMKAAPISCPTRPRMCAANSAVAVMSTRRRITSGLVVLDPASGEVKQRKEHPMRNTAAC